MKTLIPVITGLAAAGFMFCSGKAQAQPTIANVFPDGTYQFQSSPDLTFTAASAAGVTNVIVTLTGTKFTTGQGFIQVLNTASGLGISGSATSETVSAPLTSNTVYSVIIQVADANGQSVTNTLSFDTISPAYTFEAEDWDYNGGQFFDNPQTNAYFGLTSISGTDFNCTDPGHGAAYRPGGLETEVCYQYNVNTGNDKPRIQYIGTTNIDYDCGWGNAGNWVNYTRHYPAGSYYVYIRASDGNGSDADTAQLSVNSGTASISGGNNSPYSWAVPGNGWGNYGFTPLKDSAGNLAVLNILNDGTSNQLQVLSVGGDYNANFYMLLPTNANPFIAGSATVSSNYPDGNYQFEQTNQFNCTISSPVGIASSGITVQLQGTNLAGQASSTVLTAGNGLTFTGTSASWNVSFALSTDTVYAVFIQMTDVNGGSTSTNLSFDTVSPNYYTFEAEDWDYNSGQFVPEPQIDQYYQLIGNSGIDFNRNSTGGGDDYHRAGLANESTGDKQRPAYQAASLPDYDVDNTGNGDWGNFSRIYPAGTYNVYIRYANGSSSGHADAASVSLLTSGVGTSSQTTSKLGVFKTGSTGGWGTFTWAALLNSGGSLARVSFDGVSTNTLRVTTDGGSYNANYYMLVPANNSIKNPPYVSNFEPDGSTPFQYATQMTFTANSQPGMTTSEISVTLNGANVSSALSFTAVPGAAGNWNVSYAIQPNSYYTAVVTLTDAYGTTSSTNSFDTFSITNYQFEAEDYDYNGGQFFDNPQVDAYANLGSVAGIDNNQQDLTANPFTYRLNSAQNPAPATTTAGDYTRPQFANGGTDYNIGFFGGSSWCNYTRTYPAGTYNVWGRFAEGASATEATLSQVTAGFGTTSQTAGLLGSFSIASLGWGTWQWAPLKDTSGNLVKITLNGSTNTLRLGGSPVSGQPEVNVNFMMLTPANTTLPVISGLYPNGTNLFQSSTSLSFAAASSAGINTNSVVVTLNGVVVTNLVFTGSSTSWNVSANLATNSVYTAVISVTSLNGEVVTTTNSFDTISAASYQWEAEDYDWVSNGIPGQFYDNPQVDAYLGLPGLTNVDLFVSDVNAPGRGNSYRPAGYGDFPDTTANDLPRAQFTAGKTDYSIGSLGGGSWANYTRHYPAGTYNVVGRFAEGAGASSVNLSKLTGGYGTTNQSTGTIGTFAIPNNGWGTWEWVALLDGNGNPAKVTLTGSQTTLQLQGENNNEANVNFFVLTPTSPAPVVLTATPSGANVNLTFFTQTGYTYQIQYKNNLTDVSWTDLGSVIAGSNTNIVVPETFTGTSRFYRVHP